MFGTVSLPATKFKRLLLSGPPSAERAAEIQALLQQQDFLIAFDASELLIGF
jgi:hypothetical protein